MSKQNTANLLIDVIKYIAHTVLYLLLEFYLGLFEVHKFKDLFKICLLSVVPNYVTNKIVIKL